MNNFWLRSTTCLILATLAVHAEIPPLPLYPMSGSFATYIDANGYINPIFNIGNINFGQGLSLPLTLNFSSAIRSPSPTFGQGWDCPLFEAKIYDVQQNLKKVELLGGKEIYLAYNQRTNLWKHYYSDHWIGEVKDHDFKLTYDGVYQFIFHNGLISSLVLPSGRTILWNREGDKLMSMSETGKGPAVQVIYDKFGFAKQILLNPDSLGVAKEAYNFNTNLIYAGLDQIHCPDGREISFTQQHDKNLNPILEWKDNKGISEKLSWDSKTGKILSDNGFTYKITEIAKVTTYPAMFRTDKVNGKSESFYYDARHGISERVFEDGTSRHVEMIIVPGPNYKQIRLVQETKKGVTYTVLRRAFDPQGHLLLDIIGMARGKESVRQYTYDDAGRITSFILNGKEMWRNIYDLATGQLKERDLPKIGVKMAFDQLQNGQVKEMIESAGKAAGSSQLLEPNAWQAKLTFLEKIN